MIVRIALSSAMMSSHLLAIRYFVYHTLYCNVCGEEIVCAGININCASVVTSACVQLHPTLKSARVIYGGMKRKTGRRLESAQ